jgi:hypothetical protein
MKACYRVLAGLQAIPWPVRGERPGMGHQLWESWPCGRGGFYTTKTRSRPRAGFQNDSGFPQGPAPSPMVA